MQLLDQFLLAQTQWLGIPAFAAGIPNGPNGALVPDRPKRLPLLGRNDAVRSAHVPGRSIVSTGVRLIGRSRLHTPNGGLPAGLDRILPLLGGEGRGEGERVFQLNRSG